MTVKIETQQVEGNPLLQEASAPTLEELEHDRELAQRAVDGELAARRKIAELIDPLISRKSAWLCKRYCRRNRFHARCTVDSGWGVQEETALSCEWGTFTAFFLRDKLLDTSILRRYEECGGTPLAGYLAAAASAFGLEEQWKDRRFGRRMSSPGCIESMDPDARRVFWWLYDGESVATIAFRLGLDEDKVRNLVREVYDELSKAGLVHMLERQASDHPANINPDGLDPDLLGDDADDLLRDRGSVDSHWRSVVITAFNKLSWNERFLLEAMFVESLDDEQILHAVRTLNVPFVDGLNSDELGVGNVREMRNKVLVKIRKLVAE